MLVCVLAKEFSLSILRACSPKVEMLGEGQFLLEYTNDELLPSTSKGQMGIARCRFVAECAARMASPGKILRVFPGEENHFLSTLSVHFLPAQPETLRRLELLGITTMRQLALLGKDPLYQQFGEEGILLWELAQGIDERPLIPHEQAELPEVSWDFDSPCPGGAWLQGTLQKLTEQLWERLEGMVCMALSIHLQLENGECRRVDVHFAMGISQPKIATSHLWKKIDSSALRAPVVSIRLVTLAVARAVYGELSLFASRSSRCLPTACEKLKAKGKAAALMHIVWVDRSHRIPERRAYLQSLLYEKTRRLLYRPRRVEVRTRNGRLAAVGKHFISSIRDEWKVVDEWWTPRPLERTYLQVCLENGSYLRLFHEQGMWYRQ
jgi:hypothetical protein